MGLPAEEVLAWPGVIELRNYAGLDVGLRMPLLEAAVEQGSLQDFQKYALSAVEAMSHFSESDWRSYVRTLDAIRAALESAGAKFIEENGGGPGVRLQKS